MLTRPGQLSDAALAQALGAGWGITPATMEYRAVGYGSHHWEVTAGRDLRWFVTVDDLAARLRSSGDSLDVAYGRLRSALRTARAIYEAGALFVVAPVRTPDGDVVRRMGQTYAVAVYPYVDGRSRQWGDTWSAADRRVLTLIAAVHSAPPDACRSALADDFGLPGGDALSHAFDDLATRWDSGPYGEPARQLLAAHEAELGGLLKHRDQPGSARATPIPRRTAGNGRFSPAAASAGHHDWMSRADNERRRLTTAGHRLWSTPASNSYHIRRFVPPKCRSHPLESN
jgi:hypothetical protein